MKPDFAAYVQNSPELLAAFNSGTVFEFSTAGMTIAQWGQAHWNAHGQFEGRELPRSAMDADFSAYVQSYPDLLSAFNSGTQFDFTTAEPMTIAEWGKAHWLAHGSAEGRELPMLPDNEPPYQPPPEPGSSLPVNGRCECFMAPCNCVEEKIDDPEGKLYIFPEGPLPGEFATGRKKSVMPWIIGGAIAFVALHKHSR